MRQTICIILFLITCLFGTAQDNSEPDFVWGNVSYYNVDCGESIRFNSVDIKVLKLENQFNTLQIAKDTVCLKVCKRSLPISTQQIHLFVVDNKNVKVLTDDKDVHGALTKDILIGVSDSQDKMLNPNQYMFPVSFNDGFLWSAGEDSYMYSYLGKRKKAGEEYLRSYEGIGINLHDARGIQKHWIVAIENSTVVWIEDKNIGQMGKQACVLLKSDSNPNIYYVYNHLYNKNIEVKKGQKLIRGELISTVWGDEKWGHLQLLVVKSDSIPTYKNRFHNSINFFPQLYELYFKESFGYKKSFTRGKIEFGKAAEFCGNHKNSASCEEYLGKGWKLGEWNKTSKVESVSKGDEGNVRLKKVLFAGERAQSKNPKNYYEYELSVHNGVYRIRAKVGDMYKPTWQKIDFEGVNAATFSLNAGEQKWTNERVVKVVDRKLTIRVHIDKTNKKMAGLSEIVFQRAY